MYGGNQILFGEKVSRSGCGMIAACDYILYSMGKRHIPIEEYTEFVSRFRDDDAYRNSLNLLGLFPYKVIRLINKYLEGSEVVFLKSRNFSPESFRRFVFSSISAGFPVIVRVGLNGKKLPYRIEYTDKRGRSGHGKIGWHYITVTGFTDDGKVIFSSWGGKGETDISLLYRYSGLTGGIITDKREAVRSGK